MCHVSHRHFAVRKNGKFYNESLVVAKTITFLNGEVSHDLASRWCVLSYAGIS